MPCAADASEHVWQSPAGSHLPARTALPPSDTFQPCLNTLAPIAGSPERAVPEIILKYRTRHQTMRPGEASDADRQRIDRIAASRPVPEAVRAGVLAVTLVKDVGSDW